MDFNTFKHSMNRIGVLFCELLGLCEGVCLYDDQAAGFVSQRPGEDHATLGMERFKFRQMGRPIDLSLRFSLGAVKAENDELHACVIFTIIERENSRGDKR